MNFVVYSDSGEIIRAGTAPEGCAERQGGDEWSVLVGGPPCSPLTHWVNVATGLPPRITERQNMQLVVSGSTIRGIPKGAMLTTEGQQFIIEDGVADLEYEFTGACQVRIELFPWLPADVEVAR